MDCTNDNPKTHGGTTLRSDRAVRAFTITFRTPAVPSAPSCDDSGCWAGLGGPVGVPVSLTASANDGAIIGVVNFSWRSVV